MALKPENLKLLLDTYGIGVRAGVITPQVEDEKALRVVLGLPEMSKAVIADWKSTDNVRRPITLQAEESPAINEKPKNIDEK